MFQLYRRLTERHLTPTQQFALYLAFHQSLGNRILHGIFVPVILLTGAVFWVHLHVLWPISAALFGTLLFVDPAATAVFAAWVLPGCAGASMLEHSVSWTALGPFCAALHLLSWFCIVIVGHQIIEPRIDVRGVGRSSNMFFDRGYFTGFNLGMAVTPLDRAIQATLSPVALTHQLLVAFGLRKALQAEVADECLRILARLRLGSPPLEGGRLGSSERSWAA